MKKILLIVFLVLVMSACIPQSEQIKELQSVEVREYEGEKLDSVGSFRDNSIKGTQYVDIENYKLSIEGLVVVGLYCSIIAGRVVG